MTTTESAQRRLLEAIAAFNQNAGGVESLRVGLQVGIASAETTTYANFWRALDELAAAVRDDLHPKESA